MRLGGSVEIRSEAQQLVERFEMKAGRGFVLPMRERLFKSRGRINLPDGIYIARAQFQSKEARRHRLCRLIVVNPPATKSRES